jgi:hypothetical protein
VWASGQYDELRAIEARLVEQGRASELVDLLSAHNLGIGYGPSARAIAVSERLEGYLRTMDLPAPLAGRLHLLAALAAVASRDARRMRREGESAISLLTDAERPQDLAMAKHITALHLTSVDQDAGLRLFDDAIAEAEGCGAPTIAAFCFSYRAIAQFMASRGASDLATLDELAVRLDPERYTAPHSVYLQASIVRHFILDPVLARAHCARMTERHSAHGVPPSEPWLAYEALTWANVADVGAAAAAIRALQIEQRRNGDPLVDGLLPIAVLAWRLGHGQVARRWLTARRHAGQPLFVFAFAATYLQLVPAIGFDEANPLEDAPIAEIVDEADAWLTDIAAGSTRTPARLRSI